MAKIKNLYQNGQQIMPVTHEKAVQTSDGKTLDEKLSNLENKNNNTISSIESKLITAEEKLLLLELLKTAVYQSNTANQNYNKLLSAWQEDVSTLADSRPQIVSVTPNKTSITVGESITFTIVQKNAKTIRFIVDEQVNERIYDVTQETLSFSKTFQDMGNRVIAFQAVDTDGNLGLESTRLTISVKEA